MEIKDTVIKLLVDKYEFDLDEATEEVETSITTDPDFWHENADSEQLAKYLAADGSDD